MSGALQTGGQTTRRWEFVRLLLVALLAVLLGACQNAPEPPLRLGTNVWPGYEPLYLARDLGYFGTEPITLVEYPSASEVMRAFRNGSLEVAALTLDEALLLRASGIPVKIFLVTDVSHGADVILGRPGITGMQDLRGRRIGVETTALGALVLTRALGLHGLDVRDVQVVHLQVSEHESAFLDHRVDAVVTFDPVRSRLMEEAGAVELFSSREIPDEIVDVLVAHESALADNPETLRALADGWFRALEYMDKSPRRAAHLMADRLDLSPDSVLASYDGLLLPSRRQNRRMLNSEDGSLQDTVRRLESILMDWKLLHNQVDPQSLITQQIVD